MDIDEKYNEDYQVGKVQMSCDNVPTEIDGITFICRNGFGVVSGSAGSGKSNLIIWLLTHRRNKCLNGKFDRVYYISPSMDTIDKELGLNPDRVYTEFNEGVMNEINEIEREFSEEAKEEDEPMPQKLLIFDDCIVELAKPRNLAVLMKTIYNRRHLGYYIIITTQKYLHLPKKLRVSLSNKGFLVLFKTQNKAELKDIHEELIDLNKKEWEQLYEYVFPEDETYNFLYVRFDKPLSTMFHKNFNQLKIKFRKNQKIEK